LREEYTAFGHRWKKKLLCKADSVILMLTRSKKIHLKNLHVEVKEDEIDDIQHPYGHTTSQIEDHTSDVNSNSREDSPNTNIYQLEREKSDPTTTDSEHTDGNMAATKDDIEDLLKNMDNRKISAFQPVVFSGQSSESALDFLNQFENYSKLSGLKGDEKIVGFNLLLRGLAKCWFEGLSPQEKTDFDIIKNKFRETYLSQSKNWLTTQKLESRKLHPGEKVEMYIQDVIQLANNIGMTPNEQRAALIRGLSPKLRSQLITHNPQTLAETIERIYLSETALNLLNQETVNAVDSITSCQLAGINAAVSKLDEKMNNLADFTKQEGRSSGLVYNQQRQFPGPYLPGPEHTTLYQGQQPTPINNRQYSGQQNIRNVQYQPSSTRGRGPSNGACFVCGRPGHFARECFHRDSTRGGEPGFQQRFNNQRGRYNQGRGGQRMQYYQPRSKNFMGQQRF